MENAFGQTANAGREQTAARNWRVWKARVKLVVLWSLVLAPLMWGILRAFDGVNYWIPQG